MDTADASSRKALETLMHNMLMADHVSHRLVKPIVARICALRGTAEAMIAYFAEIVSEIREPITVVEKDIESEKQRQINLKIVPGIQNEDAEVRNTAIQALGLCCYLSKDLLVTYIPLFMQASQIEVEGVQVTALQILFDLLLIFGLNIVDASETSSSGSADNGPQTSEQDASSVEKASDERNGTPSKLVAIICSFLEGEVVELRTCAAEGLSKLLLSGRVVSSKILFDLIYLWYNPLSEDETLLRVCLGTFFPLYAFASRSNQEVVEKAILPTLKTFLNAPPISPLAEVDGATWSRYSCSSPTPNCSL
ncbi:condensin complex subunit 3-like [Dreissena polymorpha]|uniref:condensin complex subunit 3-like n=1 Tax=Dreissena polymorpha TaxID=45954 RepID=UPI002264E8D1|nr:condensin complex subunit 3-like [Dreissena polymorpha]XP_052251682.1 condensin complex subunit 3-like [Dreissena polymorpha]